MIDLKEFESKLLKVEQELKETSKTYKVGFNNLANEHKHELFSMQEKMMLRNGGDYYPLIRWFFDVNGIYNSLVKKGDEPSYLEYTANKKRSIRDIYLTITNDLGYEIKDFPTFIYELIKDIPFFYCSPTSLLVFHRYTIENPIKTQGVYHIQGGDYYNTHDYRECCATGLTAQELIQYYYLKIPQYKRKEDSHATLVNYLKYKMLLTDQEEAALNPKKETIIFTDDNI